MSFRALYDTILNESDLTTTDVRSESIDLLYLDNLSVQAISTGTISGTLKIEVSNDELNWTELSSPTITISNATNDSVEKIDIAYRFVRIFYDATSGTTNTLKVIICAKG